MNWLDAVGIPVLARVCLIILFPFSTLDKILDYKNALAQARSCFIPEGKVLLLIGGLIEVAGSICIVCFWYDRLAAFVMAGYCAATAILFHKFWAQGDFWSAKSSSKGREHFWNFLKNFGLAGGLFMVVLGGPAMPVSHFLNHPLSSTQRSAQP